MQKKEKMNDKTNIEGGLAISFQHPNTVPLTPREGLQCGSFLYIPNKE